MTIAQLTSGHGKSLRLHLIDQFCPGVIFCIGPKAPGCLETCVNFDLIFPFILLNIFSKLPAVLRLSATNIRYNGILCHVFLYIYKVKATITSKIMPGMLQDLE